MKTSEKDAICTSIQIDEEDLRRIENVDHNDKDDGGRWKAKGSKQNPLIEAKTPPNVLHKKVNNVTFLKTRESNFLILQEAGECVTRGIQES